MCAYMQKKHDKLRGGVPQAHNQASLASYRSALDQTLDEQSICAHRPKIWHGIGMPQATTKLVWRHTFLPLTRDLMRGPMPANANQ